MLACLYRLDYGNPISQQVYDTIISTTFTHFLSLWHSLVILYFKLFIIIIIFESDLWLINPGTAFTIWSCYCNCFEFTMKCMHKRWQIISIMCILTVSLTASSPSLSSGFPIPWDRAIFEISPVKNPIMTSRCLSKRTSCMSLTLNQKLKWLSARGKHAETEIGRVLAILYHMLVDGKGNGS